ncbi:MAG: hypothetical protein IT159_04275 [Bryobacterales bacterium]|nr:hypothetical protein [Bryobacterales bacterium]
MNQWIVWLEDAGEAGAALLGGKGARLAAMARAGLRVPSGFCLTTLASGPLTPELEEALRAAYRRLGSGPVAVRSSATSEDLETASFAGQGDTFLDVRGEEELLQAIRRCRESLWTERVAAYRGERAPSHSEPRMGVVVQSMIPTDLAGVAFSMDPVTGERTVVIEYTAGSGAGVVSGSLEPERYTEDRPGLLGSERAAEIIRTVRTLEDLFGGPQDVEWGYAGGSLWLFQSRPVTAAATGFFTEALPGDNRLWTSGFLNERFPLPVSPLGWTLIRELLEPLAFLEPLRFIGYCWPAGEPLTKLRGGRPFVNLRVFQILYKPFPECLLPEDAGRYFPREDNRLRRDAPYPRSLFDLRLLPALAWNFLRDPANWSPFHNYRVWERFTARHDREMEALQVGADNPQELWACMERAQTLNARLLAIHRWSLTHAELFYSLLRRMLAAWFGDASLAARLVAGLPSKSLESNRALSEARTEADWAEFFKTYGHRSFSLDILHPTFDETREEIRQLAGGDSQRQPAQSGTDLPSCHPLKAFLIRLVLRFTRRYMLLREDQRFYWQKTLALQRRLALALGKHFRAEETIFFATMDELRAAAGGAPLPRAAMEQRRREFARLGGDYPSFLRGREPMREGRAPDDAILRGRPVSPGVAAGPVRVLASPEDLIRLRPGDILVASSADPAWTVVFGRVQGMVLETGGQLSHAAVVAREYGLPAVTGIPGASRVLRDGERIEVDGTSGTVRVIKE